MPITKKPKTMTGRRPGSSPFRPAIVTMSVEWMTLQRSCARSPVWVMGGGARWRLACQTHLVLVRTQYSVAAIAMATVNSAGVVGRRV